MLYNILRMSVIYNQFKLLCDVRKGINMSVGLVLEGGGMRGIYTSGVLDCLMNNNIFIKDVYAVSAGAANAVSYKSKQPRRNFKITTTFCHDKRYLDPVGMLTENMFKMDFAFKVIPRDYYPFDNETFKSSDMRLTAVTTSCLTGKPFYHELTDMDIDYTKVMASCSLPVVCRSVILDGVPHMDGGISDPIPLEYSIKCGNKKNIVVLTRPIGYAKKPSGSASSVVGRLKYKHYPNLLRAGARRAEVYNNQLRLTERKELLGEALVLRPSGSCGIERTERNPVKLMALYRLGYNECLERLDDIRAFIKE